MKINEMIQHLPMEAVQEILNSCISRIQSSTRELTPEEKNLCANNRRVSAVKSAKDRLGLSLKQAKDLVDFCYPRPNKDAFATVAAYSNGQRFIVKNRVWTIKETHLTAGYDCMTEDGDEAFFNEFEIHEAQKA